ncbi:ribosome-binding protein 1-like isoform X2 [Lingula anatina]|uniref:Ribosome-binding protein 1-like isoform X2 n=1 Tax=Lingula anatina TaxID=7574 RepID=A0A1S3HUY3_LINAN|nr:ribosome-binding protein 1-like isoform X2 [Lingula anatina]|eukprot:XP_013389828.1 ribosome-binding protein 1-like isoform X2 [Lingula anatina]
MSAFTEVNKVDMSLDDIIKLNRKEKKSLAVQKRAKQTKKVVPAMAKVKQFRSKFSKGAGNKFAGQTQLKGQGNRRQNLSQKRAQLTTQKGRRPVNTVAKRALQAARKTLTRKNTQQMQKQARQNLQMQKRGLQEQPAVQNRRRKLNRGYVGQQAQQIQQPQQRKRQWRNKAGKNNNQNILTVSINNNRRQQNQVLVRGQYPQQGAQGRNNQQRRQRRNMNRQQNMKQIIQHLQPSVRRQYNMNSGNMSVNQTGRTMSDRFSGGNQISMGRGGGRRRNRQRGGRGGGGGGGGGNNFVQNRQQNRQQNQGNRNRNRQTRGRRGGGPQRGGGSDRVVFW